MCEGSMVTLNCNVTGNPSPFVAWISASGTVLQNSTNITSYRISHVTKTDEENYICQANNIVGEDVGSTIIRDVQSKFDIKASIRNFVFHFQMFYATCFCTLFYQEYICLKRKCRLKSQFL